MVNQALSRPVITLRSFLGRLARDRAANVLAIFAACLPPILILVGGGIDMSRAYMAQTALQNACDAGVLAGRRAQTVSGVWTTAEQTKASRMFNFNFNSTSQSANASGTIFTPTNPGSGVISGTASTTIPTTIMKIFGTNSFGLTATCSAKFVISNIDVMMVLDTTGSMACKPDGTTCDSSSTSKIEGLKSAVRSFYYTLAGSVPLTGTRLRFGFVPYAGTVNMGGLVTDGDIPQSYIASTANYQTRVGVFDRAIWQGTKTGSSTTIETMRNLSQSECYLYQYNKYPDNTSQNPQQSGTPPSNVSDTSYTPDSYTAGSRRNQSTCTRKKITSTITGSTATRAFTLSAITYKRDAVDTSTFKTRTAINVATSVLPNATVTTTGTYDMVQLGALTGTTGITTGSVTWNGCIEERATVNSLISATSIPTGATDLDLASAPVSDATRWKPYFSNIVFDRGGFADVTQYTELTPITEYCVPAAKKFTTVDTSVPATVPSWIETYLTSLYAWGGTYHDVGMIWGARLANQNGIMSANVNSGNLSSVNRNLIFLTDGEMSPYCEGFYGAYGVEYLDRRVAPTTSLTGSACDDYLQPYNNGRFLAACQLAKNMGYTVWVIGFGLALSTEMTTCASSGRSYYASDNDALQTAFRTIAAQIADLRLET